MQATWMIGRIGKKRMNIGWTDEHLKLCARCVKIKLRALNEQITGSLS